MCPQIREISLFLVKKGELWGTGAHIPMSFSQWKVKKEILEGDLERCATIKMAAIQPTIEDAVKDAAKNAVTP